MHQIKLPEHILSRVISRRGSLHPFNKIDCRSTAVIVIDMQNAFCEPGGILETPSAREIVPNINRITKAIRDKGGLVVWVQMTIPQMSDWPVYLGDLVPEGASKEILESLQPGSRGNELWSELNLSDEDLICKKTRFSAFLSSSSPLEDMLRRHGIETVIITGTLTNVCCESSARDAAMQDFRVIMVSDGNACRSDEEHNASLTNIIQFFGDVRTTDSLLSIVNN